MRPALRPLVLCAALVPALLFAGDEIATGAEALFAANRHAEGAELLLRAAREAAERGDLHAAYWYQWRVAGQRPGPWTPAERLALYDQALAYWNQCAPSDARRRSIDLPNLAAMCNERETLFARQGLFAQGFQAHTRAESAVKQALDNEVTDQRLAAAPGPIAGIWAETLVDRAAYAERAGRLADAETDLLQAVQIIERHVHQPGDRRSQLARCWNNLSTMYGRLGRDRDQERALARAKDLGTGSPHGLISEVNEIRNRADVVGATEQDVARLRQIAGTMRERMDLADSLVVDRMAAVLLVDMNRVAEGLALFDAVLAEMHAKGYRADAAEAHFWRAKARAGERREGAEADFIAALDFFRRAASKLSEYRVYVAYAEFLAGAGRAQEAVSVAAEALQLNRRMGATMLRPRILAVLADALRATGRRAEADALWNEALALADSLPEMSGSRRLDLWVARLDYLRKFGTRSEWETAQARARKIAADASLTAYQCRDLESRGPPAPGSALAAELVPPALQLHPLYTSTRVAGNATARGLLWLVNPAAAPQDVELVMTGPELSATTNGGLLTASAPPGAGAGRTVRQRVCVPAFGLLPLEARAQPDGSAPVVLYFATSVQTTRWEAASGAEAWESRTRIQSSLAACNPFHGLPLYHEIALAGGASTGGPNFRVRASSPARIEVEARADGRMLAVDAEGDGRFDAPGDLLWQDADGDGHPDGATAVLLRIYPAADRPAVEHLDLVVEARDAAGRWLAVGHDRLLDFGRTRPPAALGR